jgi:hypothetical protein
MKHLLILAIIGLTFNCVIAQSTTEAVNLRLADTDPTYAKRLKHHIGIKAFLNARKSGDACADPLLICLLQSGFSIDDFPKAYFVVKAPIGSRVEPYVTALREKGMSEEDIQLRLKRRAVVYNAERRKVIKQITGVMDDAFVDSLIALPCESKDHPRFALDANCKEGEPLLTEADWMTETHKKAIASHSGEARQFSSHPVSLSSDQDSLLTAPPAKE